jgi:hypothetical protein
MYHSKLQQYFHNIRPGTNAIEIFCHSTVITSEIFLKTQNDGNITDWQSITAVNSYTTSPPGFNASAYISNKSSKQTFERRF